MIDSKTENSDTTNEVGAANKRTRKVNPAKNLITAKRKLDEVLPLLDVSSELSTQAQALRKAVLKEWMREEEKLPQDIV